MLHACFSTRPLPALILDVVVRGFAQGPCEYGFNTILHDSVWPISFVEKQLKNVLLLSNSMLFFPIATGCIPRPWGIFYWSAEPTSHGSD